jgi:hypothetical protein
VTPFSVAGVVGIRFDGEMCGASIETSGAGFHLVSFAATTGVASGALLAGVREPMTWADLLTALETFDLATGTPPEWYIDGGTLTDPKGSGDPVTTATALEAATYGPLCFTGTWPDLAITPGAPFDIPD